MARPRFDKLSAEKREWILEAAAKHLSPMVMWARR